MNHDYMFVGPKLVKRMLKRIIVRLSVLCYQSLQSGQELYTLCIWSRRTTYPIVSFPYPKNRRDSSFQVFENKATLERQTSIRRVLVEIFGGLNRIARE